MDNNDSELVASRRIVFEAAIELVAPIVEQHGLETYRNQTTPLTNNFTATSVDQHIDHIIRVADWLLDKES